MNTSCLDLEQVGKRIRQLRKKHQKTQEAFAETIHISTSYLALIELGKRTASLDVIAQISNEYHVTVDYLLFGKAEEPGSVNLREFTSLCEQYPTKEIAKALRLSAFYLGLDKQKK